MTSSAELCEMGQKLVDEDHYLQVAEKNCIDKFLCEVCMLNSVARPYMCMGIWY